MFQVIVGYCWSLRSPTYTWQSPCLLLSVISPKILFKKESFYYQDWYNYPTLKKKMEKTFVGLSLSVSGNELLQLRIQFFFNFILYRRYWKNGGICGWSTELTWWNYVLHPMETWSWQYRRDFFLDTWNTKKVQFFQYAMYTVWYPWKCTKLKLIYRFYAVFIKGYNHFNNISFS